MRTLSNKTIEYGILLALTLAGSLLLLPNLGNQYLWQDEAQKALVAKTVLAHGIPLGYDGRNYFSQDGGGYGRNYVWNWHPWLQFYLLAAFFALFGEHTAVARLPFALVGVGTVLLLYLFAKRLWASRRAGITAAVVLLLSVPFLILARQCGYYSLAIFFTLLALHTYLGLIAHERYATVGFIVATTLLFHTHYIYTITLLLAAGVHAALFHRGRIRAVVLASAIVLLANGPWLAWFASVYHGSRSGEVFSSGHFWQFCGHYLGLLAKNVFPPLLLLVPVVIGAVCWLQHKRLPALAPSLWQNLVLLGLFLFTTLIAVARAAPEPYFRYLGPLIPICAAMIALLAEWCMKSHVLAGGALVLLLAFKQPIPNYLYEITHDYDGPIEGIVRYLQDRARPADVVAITYGDLPVKFYTNLRVVGGLTGEDLSPAKEADWIVCRKYYVTKLDLAVRNYLMANIDWQKYRRVELDYPDIPFENREEPQLHRYRTVTNAPRVVVYEKIR